MKLQPDTDEFLRQLEAYVNRELHFRAEVGTLIDLAQITHRSEVFGDAIFLAKFLTKSFDIMKRIGKDGEGYDKLAVEFETNLEKASTLIRTLVKDSPDEVKQRFVRTFFGMDQSSLSDLMKLFVDLSWVKNWEVDGKPLPYGNAGT